MYARLTQEQRDAIASRYTPEQAALLDKVDELAEQLGSRAKACTRIGNPATGTAISQIISGTYAADPINVFRHLAEYFSVKADAARTRYQEVEYTNTSFSERAYDLMRICHAKGVLTIICGDAGIGKTKAIEKYVQDHPTNTVSITVNCCFSREKPLLSLLAESMGLVSEKTADANWKQIARKLTDGTLIIVDEAQNLTQKTVDLLRSFPDAFKKNKKTVGVCLVGNIDTVHKFGKASSTLSQIKNRSLHEGVFSAARTERSDITKIFPFLHDGENDAEIDFLLHVARSDAGIRGAVYLVSDAYDNENISYAGLVAAAKDMNIQI